VMRPMGSCWAKLKLLTGAILSLRRAGDKRAMMASTADPKSCIASREFFFRDFRSIKRY